MAVFVQVTGLAPYEAAYAAQRALVDARAERAIPDVVLLLEHPPTITVGRRRGAMDSVRAPGDLPVVAIERGGDATLHAPGQLVAWPILALEGERRDLIRHLRGLEDGVMALLGALGVRGVRDPRNTGVWIPEPDAAPRKVCAIGVSARRWVTGHGLALNLTIDRAWFDRLDPCGLPSATVTRLADHLPGCPSPADLAPDLALFLADALDIPVEGPVREVEANALPELAERLRG